MSHSTRLIHIVISQTSEPAASASLLSAIFTSPASSTLTEILSDANNGAQMIGKIIAINTITTDERDKLIEAVRAVLPGIKASNTPPYRSLLEIVGLPVPAGPGPSTSPYAARRGGYQGGQAGPGRYAGAGGYGAARGLYGGQQQGQQGAAAQGYRQPQAQQGKGLAPLALTQGSPRGSPRTPVPQNRGRMSPSSMMSPGSDPFNPVSQLILRQRAMLMS